MEGTTVIFVFSNAGYGLTVRGYYPDQAQADLKMGRLAKKGHTDIEYRVAEITKVEKYKAEV